MKTALDWLQHMKSRPCVTENDLLVIITQIQNDAVININPLLCACKTLLHGLNNAEVLGEWEALDINTSLRKTSRAKLEKIKEEARTVISQYEQL